MYKKQIELIPNESNNYSFLLIDEIDLKEPKVQESTLMTRFFELTFSQP